MCLGGGGGYTPPPVKRSPDPQPGPPSRPDMVNDTIIPNANPRDQQEAARGEFDPPNRSQLKSQSSVSLGGTVTPQPARKSGSMGAVARNNRSAKLKSGVSRGPRAATRAQKAAKGRNPGKR